MKSVWRWLFLLLLKMASTKLLEGIYLAHQKRSLQSRQLLIPGDVILGGLFTIHKSCTLSSVNTGNKACKKQSYKKTGIRNEANAEEIFSRDAFHDAIAMLSAVADVNRKKTLLPGIKLGVDIKDTCGSMDYAVWQFLNFSFVKRYLNGTASCSFREGYANSSRENKNASSNRIGNKTVAVIGPDLSDIARAVADLASLFDIPIVSPSATNQVFDDRQRFPYFFRTVSPDNIQAKLMIELINYFKWNYVALLTSDDDYGRSGQNALRHEIRKSQLPICTVIDDVINLDKIPTIIAKIKNIKEVKIALIVFATDESLMQILNEFRNQNLIGHAMILSDAWTRARLIPSKYAKSMHGILGISTRSTKVEGFRDALIDVLENSDHWSRDFSAREKQRCGTSDMRKCIKDDINYSTSPFVASTYDAVYAIAYALHTTLHCSNNSCRNPSLDGKEFISNLKQVRFKGVSKNEIYFNEFGSTTSSYQVFNLRRTKAGLFDFVPVADWSDTRCKNSCLKWLSDVIFYNETHQVPFSNCSINCRPGEHKVVNDTFPECCWTCRRCKAKTFSKNINALKCSLCDVSFTSNHNNTGCIPVKDYFLNWNSPLASIILAWAIANFILVIFTAFLLFKHRETPLIKSSNIVLMHLLLLSIIAFNVITVSSIGRPTDSMCVLTPCLLGICISLNAGTILVKANQIARMQKKFRENSSFLYKRYQYYVITGIVLVGLVISLIWVFTLDKPHLEEKTVDHEKQEISCSYRNCLKGVSIWSLYFGGLVLICTVESFLVRNAPHNHNEGKFLFYAMLSMLGTFIISVSITLGTTGYLKNIVNKFMFVFLATVEFSCIFAPKVYIILFRPHKNRLNIHAIQNKGD